MRMCVQVATPLSATDKELKNFLKVSEESLGRDETPCQTSHEHFTSI